MERVIAMIPITRSTILDNSFTSIAVKTALREHW